MAQLVFPPNPLTPLANSTASPDTEYSNTNQQYVNRIRAYSPSWLYSVQQIISKQSSYLVNAFRTAFVKLKNCLYLENDVETFSDELSTSIKFPFYFIPLSFDYYQYHILCLVLTIMLVFLSTVLYINIIYYRKPIYIWNSYEIFLVILWTALLVIYAIEVVTSPFSQILSSLDTCPHVSTVISRFEAAFPTLELRASSWHFRKTPEGNQQVERLSHTQLVEFRASKDLSNRFLIHKKKSMPKIQTALIPLTSERTVTVSSSLADTEKLSSAASPWPSEEANPYALKTFNVPRRFLEHCQNEEPFDAPQHNTKLRVNNQNVMKFLLFEEKTHFPNVSWSDDLTIAAMEGPVGAVLLNVKLSCAYSDIETEDYITDTKNKLREMFRWKDDFFDLTESFCLLDSPIDQPATTPTPTILCRLGDATWKCHHWWRIKAWSLSYLLSKKFNAFCLPVYFFFSLILLSWPYRLLFQQRIVRASWALRKIVSVTRTENDDGFDKSIDRNSFRWSAFDVFAGL